jgi:hypothetical protein
MEREKKYLTCVKQGDKIDDDCEWCYGSGKKTVMAFFVEMSLAVLHCERCNKTYHRKLGVKE